MAEQSDKILAERCLEGKQAYCRMLFDRYNRYVAAILWRQLSSLKATDPDEVKDIAQEVFCKAFKALGSFRWESSFKTWITTIALNSCRSYLSKNASRKQDKHDSLHDTDDGSTMDISDNAEGDPSKILGRAERISLLQRAMTELSEEHRTAIQLLLEGMSYSEIAETTGVSIQTVGSRICYAKKYLKDLLQPYYKG